MPADGTVISGEPYLVRRDGREELAGGLPLDQVSVSY